MKDYCIALKTIALHYRQCNALAVKTQFFQWRSLKSQTSEIAQWNSTKISQCQMTNFVLISIITGIIMIIIHMFCQIGAEEMWWEHCWQADDCEMGEGEETLRRLIVDHQHQEMLLSPSSASKEETCCKFEAFTWCRLSFSNGSSWLGLEHMCEKLSADKLDNKRVKVSFNL